MTAPLTALIDHSPVMANSAPEWLVPGTPSWAPTMLIALAIAEILVIGARREDDGVAVDGLRIGFGDRREPAIADQQEAIAAAIHDDFQFRWASRCLPHRRPQPASRRRSS